MLRLKPKLRPDKATPHATHGTTCYTISSTYSKTLQVSETFSGIVDDIAVKNWLKKVSDTLIDMELDDELKLRVAT